MTEKYTKEKKEDVEEKEKSIYENVLGYFVKMISTFKITLLKLKQIV